MAYFGVITTMLVAGFGATCVCVCHRDDEPVPLRRADRRRDGRPC